MFSDGGLEEVLRTLGDVLEQRRQSAGILVVGGGSLLLLGLISRPTADLDVAGLVDGSRYVRARPLPEFLQAAARDVAQLHELSPSWLNDGPADLLDFPLPEGCQDRVHIRHYGTLEVHIPDRQDLVCLKLYAAVDLGPASKHFQDLLALRPSDDELDIAATWCSGTDGSNGFAADLEGAVNQLRSERGGQ
jgi:hypothetical protein